jgi:transposase
MSETEVKISSERIDDIPLIVEWLKQIEIAKHIDQKLKKPHGNHQGMSYGQLSVLFLTYIITQSDHRLCAVEAWVETHRRILELSTGWSIGEKDASDDRLARVVEELGKQSQARQEIEIKLGRQIIKAYELPTKIARTDTTSFSVNHENQSDLDVLGYKVENILKRYRVTEFFSTTITEEMQTETRHIGRGRPSKNSLQQQITSIQLQLRIEQIDSVIQEAETLAGWRLYVTNARIEQLTLSQSVMYYRDQWLLERGFHRFKRGSLPALPIYFQNQNRITGLMFLLNITLRVFTLMEFVVRLALQQTQESLQGLYNGNPKRKTHRPSAELMLKAFCNLTLYFLPDSTVFITPINQLQKQILAAMKMPEFLYELELKLCMT